MGCEALGARVHALIEQPLPDAVRAAAQRALLNVTAAAIAGSRHEVVETTLRLAERHGGAPVAPVAGRAEKVDAYFSALLNGIAARVLGFDDAHLGTMCSPAAPQFAVTTALAATHPVSGARMLTAFALGCEVTLRLAAAVAPGHFELGWDPGSTCGTIGAAIAGTLVLGGDAKHLSNAIGIAASSTLGQREALGTSSGALHAGKAASNGAIAALLATRGFTGERPLDHPDGFFRVFPPPDRARVDAIAGDLGERWMLLELGFKPYPCDVLGHPAVEGTLALRRALAGKGAIEEIRITSHPKVAEFSGVVDPRNELEATFSTPHAVAAAAVDGEFGLAQVTPLRLADSDIVELRDSILFLSDEGCALDAATVEVELKSGDVLRHDVAHAKGTAATPLSDEELFAKVRALVEPVIPGASPTPAGGG